MAILEGAIIGSVVGVITIFATHRTKKRQYERIRKSITEPNVEYIGMFHMASNKRYKKSIKFFDSFGALYLVDHMLYYKSAPDKPPISFDLKECSLQWEENWKMLKWFSVMTVVGEKFYFNSHKMGAFKSNSDETERAFDLLNAKGYSS
jgi:hypothetical protein